MWAADEFGTVTTPDTPELERLHTQIDQLTTQLATARTELAAAPATTR